MKKLIVFIALVSVSVLASCKKFLAENSQNLAYVKTADDLSELLLGEGYMKLITNQYPSPYFSLVFGQGSNDAYYPYLDILNDDAEEFLTGNPQYATGVFVARNALSGFHRWQADPWLSLQGTVLVDNDWPRFYKHIAALNAIIYKAGQLKGTANTATLNRVEGEARFLRAGYYFLMANLYGMPYNKATASTDISVPLKITEDVVDEHYKRDNVATVYNQILADLTLSASLLSGVSQSTIFRVNQAAAYAMLSRVNLYMENYQAASDAADKVLVSGYQVSDLNNYAAGSSFCTFNSPENIFSQGAYTTNNIFVDESYGFVDDYKASADLLSIFASNDLRLNAFFMQSSGTKQLLPAKCRTPSVDAGAGTMMSSIFLLRLPEVILNKAEAQAINGDESGAKTTLATLLIKRYKPTDVPQLTQSGAALVNYIRDERRRELCFEGQRWFDLKRYAVNSKYPFSKTIRHNTYDYNATANTGVITGYYQLNPYAQDVAAYLTPIPVAAIQFNQGTLTNPTRAVRSMN
jgi:hypothetical protein